MGNPVDLTTWRGRLKAARIAAGLSGPELSDRLGKNRNWAYATEKGNGSPDPEALAEIAAVLGCTVEWLVTGQQAGRTEFVDQMAALEPQLDSIGIRTVRGVTRLQVEESALRRQAVATLSDEEAELLLLIRSATGQMRQAALSATRALLQAAAPLESRQETEVEVDPRSRERSQGTPA